MEAFTVEQLLAQQANADALYYEFLRRTSLSVGLYALPAGGTDPQSPHAEDEVYYVLEGQGMITVGEEQLPVHKGSIIFVPKKQIHYFHDIAEALTVLVFFAPAEGTEARQAE